MSDPICATCECKGYVAFCNNRTEALSLPVYTEPHTRVLRALILTGTEVVLHPDSFQRLHWLGRLHLAATNQQGQLPGGVFRGLSNLFELDLSANHLTALQAGIFSGLQSIRKVDLSSNRLSSLHREVLWPIRGVHVLILTHNPRLRNVGTDTFKDLMALRQLHTDAYKFCCIAPHVEQCTPEADQFSSCEDLMANFALQISIWVLGCCAFSGNLFVVIWRIKTDRSKVSSFFIINLGCSDFLMGVYMLIIASVDVHYRGRYILHADAWRSSVLCQLAGILAMVSSEVSVFTLTAITLDRTLTILYPLKMGQVRLKHGRAVMACGWAVCLVISVLPAMHIPYFGEAFFGRTGQQLQSMLTINHKSCAVFTS